MTSFLEPMQHIISGQGDPRQPGNTATLYNGSVELDYYRGLIHRASGKLNLAEQCFKKVLADYRNLGVGETIEYQMAAISVGRGDNQIGLSGTLSLESSFRQQGLLRPKLAGLLRVQAEALLNLGETSEALSRLEEGIADLGFYQDPDLLWRLQ